MVRASRCFRKAETGADNSQDMSGIRADYSEIDTPGSTPATVLVCTLPLLAMGLL